MASTFRTVFLSTAAILLVPMAAAAGTETVLHTFLGANAGDGNGPFAAPVMDSHGDLYGTTVWGGSGDAGTVYKLHLTKSGTWKETVLHSFLGGDDGEYVIGGVIFDSHGNLYGATSHGGNECGYGCGVVYELTPGNGTWAETILYKFKSPMQGDGSGPTASLTFDAKGNLYGMTSGDGACGYGNVFELRHTSSGWKEQDLHDFCGSDGKWPSYAQL